MGKFIIIEGPDFCGKSTQIDLLNVNRIMTGALGDNVFFTREPGSYLPESMEVVKVLEIKFLTTTILLWMKQNYLQNPDIIIQKKLLN
jgi:thymidylate kinase